MPRPKHEVLAEIATLEAEIVKLDDLPLMIPGVSGDVHSIATLRYYLRERLRAARKEAHEEFGIRQGPYFTM